MFAKENKRKGEKKGPRSGPRTQPLSGIMIPLHPHRLFFSVYRYSLLFASSLTASTCFIQLNC